MDQAHESVMEEHRRVGARAERRRRDIQAVAATPEGRRLLAALVADDLVLDGKFHGNSHDAYLAGRRHVAIELRQILKQVLPRERFVEIVVPLEEE